MAKKKRKAAAAPAATNVLVGPKPLDPIDLVALPREVERRVDELSRWNSAFYKKKQVVEDLRKKLAEAEGELEFLARPLRAVEAVTNPEALAKFAAEKIYDDGLRACLGKIRYKIRSSNYNPRTRRYESKSKPTGAKRWRELKANGATDAQILRNLKSIDTGYPGCRADGYELDRDRGQWVLWKGEANRHGSIKLLTVTEPQLAVESRRVFGIAEIAGPKPRPAQKKKPAGKPKSSAAPKKPSKSPAASRKKTPSLKAKSPPAAKAGAKRVYKSGAQKRREKLEREAKGTAPAAEAKATPALAGVKSAGPVAAAVRELEQTVREGEVSKLLNFAKPGAAMSAPWAAALHLPEGHPLRAKRCATGADVGKACEQCSCTYNDECEGGCYWVDVGDDSRWLCSKCADNVPAKKTARSGVVNSDEVPASIAGKKPRRSPSKLLNGAAL